MTESRNLTGIRPAPARPAGLEGMRDMLRGGSLARSLSAASAEDRLAAAWVVICGRALAERSGVAEYRDGLVLVHVVDATWLAQLLPLRAAFATQLAAASHIPVRSIEFAVRRTRPS